VANFLSLNEGENYVGQNGLPATCRFLLSTKSVDATSPFAATDTLVGNQDGEITGTGYARLSEARPTPVAGLYSFAIKSWSTGAATDWPAAVRSIVLVTTADDTGVMICVWNLVVGGAARDLSLAGTTENFTPSLQIGTA
jgi:hypothetical protein